jgi:L-ascorbate metabolism protein UlaG (beta-lactamase superfamily)
MKALPPNRTRTALVCVALAFCACGIGLAENAGSGLRRYDSLVVSDLPVQSSSAEPPAQGVRVTYLGTNGYLFEASDSTILIDPYFSRVGLAPVALNIPTKPNIQRINAGMNRLPKWIDAILVTHGHFDHLLDVPEIARRTGASVIGSPTSCYLVQAVGLPLAKTFPVLPGDSVRFRNARVHVLPAVHDRILGIMPFPGVQTRVPRNPPRRPSDWVCGEPLAFLIEIGGKRIYVDAGGTVAALPSPTVDPVDLAILGVYLRASRSRVLPALRKLQPRYFLPSHQDNFFRPLSDGFRFGPMTRFNAVLRSVKEYQSEPLRPTRLILLDYFAPWTLR